MRLHSATSDPKGPVYLWARREVLEEEIDSSIMDTKVDTAKWPSLKPGGLSPDGMLQWTAQFGRLLIKPRSCYFFE